MLLQGATALADPAQPKAASGNGDRGRRARRRRVPSSRWRGGQKKRSGGNSVRPRTTRAAAPSRTRGAGGGHASKRMDRSKCTNGTSSSSCSRLQAISQPDDAALRADPELACSSNQYDRPVRSRRASINSWKRAAASTGPGSPSLPPPAVSAKIPAERRSAAGGRSPVDTGVRRSEFTAARASGAHRKPSRAGVATTTECASRRGTSPRSGARCRSLPGPGFQRCRCPKERLPASPRRSAP